VGCVELVQGSGFKASYAQLASTMPVRQRKARLVYGPINCSAISACVQAVARRQPTLNLVLHAHRKVLGSYHV
jgi:hypothetical protein